MNRILIVILASSALLTGANATPATGNTFAFGDFVGSGPWEVWTTGPNGYGGVDFVPNQTFTFAQLTNVNSSFTALSGGSSLGSPRIVVGLQDGANEDYVNILLGDSPNFVDTDTQLDAYSGVNLIGNNDTGRYDTSGFAGGSPFTTYSSALSLVGAFTVDEIYFVADSTNQEFIVGSVNAAYTPAALPDSSATWALLLLALVATLGLKQRSTTTA